MSREGPHVLFCAFAEVPGPTAVGVRTAQMMRAFGAPFVVDGLCLKGPEVAHIERLGAVRVMRVPVENKPFLERLAAFQRALGRQIAGERYDIVWCADLLSGAVAASYKEAHGFSLIVDVPDLPSASFERRYEVDPADKKLRAEWSQGEKAALRSATVVFAPSRGAAKALTGRVDPSKVTVLLRAVDRERFSPPSVEVALDGRRTVLVVGGREGGPLLEPSVQILKALAAATAEDEVALTFTFASPTGDERAQKALFAAGLKGRVRLSEIADAPAMAAALAEAHVVVVPSLAEVGVDLYAPPHRALEAMAARRPTVLTGPEAAFAGALVPGEDALVSPAKDPAAVAGAVRKLLDAPALREAVAQSGARRVEQEADLATRLEQVAAFLRDRFGVAFVSQPESTSPADRPGSESSSVFTDGGFSTVTPLRPPAVEERASPEAPSEAPRDEAPPPDPLPDDKTLVAPPPEGLEELFLTPSEGGDDWYGDTRIEPGDDPFASPTPLEERARATTKRRVLEPSTSTEPPGARTFAAEPMSLPDGDPWGHDTIADARPVFTSDDVGKKAPPPAKTVAAEGTGRSFLVDPERFGDETVDEMQLPREISSSEG